MVKYPDVIAALVQLTEMNILGLKRRDRQIMLLTNLSIRANVKQFQGAIVDYIRLYLSCMAAWSQSARADINLTDNINLDVIRRY